MGKTDNEGRIRTNLVVLEHNDAALYKQLAGVPRKAIAARIRYLAHMGALLEENIKSGGSGFVKAQDNNVTTPIVSGAGQEKPQAAATAPEPVLPKKEPRPMEGIDLDFGMG